MGKSRGRKQDMPYRSHDRSGARTSTQNRGKDKRSAQVAEERVLEYFPEFHSAVNRIPVPREEILRNVGSGELPAELFEDAPAFGHDHLVVDRWSGSIDLEMLVRTPLVFGEQEKLDGENGPTTVRLPMFKGDLFVPPTMVKGMLSRAYETLTASRFRIFGDHDESLTYRTDPAGANNLYGGRVTRDPNTGKLAVEILGGKGKQQRFAFIRDNPDSGPGTLHAQPGKTLPQRSSKPPIPGPRPEVLPHGKLVKVEVSEWEKKSGTSLLIVTKVFHDDQEVDLLTLPLGEVKSTFTTWGYACRTAPHGKIAADMFPDKKYERFFFRETHGSELITEALLELTEEHIERYRVVLRSYVAEHDEREGRTDQKPLNRPASISRKRKKDSENPPLKEGDLVFIAPLDHGNGDFNAFEIVPTMVGRRAYSVSPRTLAQQQAVLPLSRREEASPADRLFGYVIQHPSDSPKGGNVAYRGRLSFGVVDTTQTRISDRPKLLAPLLGAKLGSARRFLTDSHGRTPNENKVNVPKSGLYVEGQYLGIAAFPVHRASIEESGFPSSATELPPKNGMEPANDKTRLKAANWVEPGSVLRCKISFENLTELELAALLWLLDPKNLVPEAERVKDPDACGYLRMGLGKPLGLGAVEVRIAENGLLAHQGCIQSEQYFALTGCNGSDASPQNVDSFVMPNVETLLEKSWVQAFQRAAFGYSDGISVCYMTLDENKKNNQTNEDGQPRVGAGVSPRDMWGDEQAKPLQVPKDWERIRRG